MTRKPQPQHPSNLPDVLAWSRAYLADYFSDPPAPFHHELLGDLRDADRRLLARVAPRGHAKSTCAAFAYPLWCICHQQRRNIVIITHEASLATQFVRDIRHELESNEHLLAAYGDLCTPATTPHGSSADTSASPAPQRAARTSAPKKPSRAKWTQELFTTTTGISVQAKGSGASFRGARVGPHRPDLIICDDIEKDEHVASPEGRRKLEYWLRRVVLPALAPDGRLVLLGSIIHYDSLLANLRDRQRFPGWDYKVYRALEAELRADGQYYRVALWPARWPLARLDHERHRVGTLAFEQEYMANPIDDSVRVFRPEWLQPYHADLDAIRERLVTLMAIDPATGATGGDFFALWVGQVDISSGIIYTRELTLERIGVVQQVKRIVAAFERWRPIKIGIETTAYQVALKDILEDYGRTNHVYMPIVAIQTLVNKRARIEGSSVFYENGTFRLPPGLSPDIESQFLHFPKARHDDAPDVCAMGIELARAARACTRIEGLTARRNSHPRHDAW